MTTTIFLQKTRRQAMKKMSLPLLLLLLCIALNGYYPYRSINKPAPIRTLQQLSTHSPDKKPFISIGQKELFYSGIDFQVKNQITGSYYYTVLEDTLLFFLLTPHNGTPEDQIRTDQQVKGLLMNYNSDYQTLVNHMAEDLNWSASELSHMSYPYIIDSRPEQYRIPIIGFFAALLFLLFLIFLILKQIFYILFPKKAPFYQTLESI